MKRRISALPTSALTHSTLQINRHHNRLLQIHSADCPDNPANRPTPTEAESHP